MALLVLDNRDSAEVHEWLMRDIEQRFDFNQELLISNATDVNFQASAIYNVALLPNIDMNLE